MSTVISYGEGIREAHAFALGRNPKFFVLGQGVWAPWYVGNSMKDLDKEFGVDRIIDTPVSEAACTGAALGASLCGYKVLVVHPRVDFMILAIDQIVTQAANWSHMFGGAASPSVTFRGIVNRGGEQGAQHSQALQSWFAHVPGLRVVMPATARDARDLLIGSILDPGPVVFIDDRWLYEQTEEAPTPSEISLDTIRPFVRRQGRDLTLVGIGYGVKLALDAAKTLESSGISVEVIDMRVVNPIHIEEICESIRKTGRLGVVDLAWKTCSVASEIVALAVESCPPAIFKAAPFRIALPDSPAPTSRPLEKLFYFDSQKVVEKVTEVMS